MFEHWRAFWNWINGLGKTGAKMWFMQHFSCCFKGRIQVQEGTAVHRMGFYKDGRQYTALDEGSMYGLEK